jgi:putative endonuclease
MAQHNQKGKEGEEQALLFLKGKGYQVLEVNWRFGKLEADIIALDREKLVFVEVKTRSDTLYGEPEQAVTLKKQRHLIRAANQYIELKDFNGETRFDIVTVMDEADGSYAINHIEDAFYPLL